jgi:hypothetical protein
MRNLGTLLFMMAVAISIVWAQTSATASNSTNPSNGTAIVARLLTNLDARHSKVGDPVEAETTQDVKQNGQILLRKGSRVTGQVAEVVPYSKETRQSKLRLVFDNVATKEGERMSAQLTIYALAGEPKQQTDIQDPRGMVQTDINASAAGGLGGPQAGLTPQSRGVIGLQGLSLASAGAQGSVVSSTSRDVHLAKGTQMLLVISQ